MEELEPSLLCTANIFTHSHTQSNQEKIIQLSLLQKTCKFWHQNCVKKTEVNYAEIIFLHLSHLEQRHRASQRTAETMTAINCTYKNLEKYCGKSRINLTQ